MDAQMNMGMNRQKPSVKILVVWQIRTILFCLIPSLATSVLWEAGSASWRVATSFWLFCACAMLFVYFPVRYLRASFALECGWLVVTEGAVYGRTRALPIKNIQFVTLFQTPLEALFGLKTVICHAPGGKVFISGLPNVAAGAIYQTLWEGKND